MQISTALLLAAAVVLAVAAPTSTNGTGLQWCNSQRYDPTTVPDIMYPRLSNLTSIAVRMPR
jgi:hypothetical protein